MAKPIVRVVPNARGMEELRDRLANGLLAVVQDAELEAKRETPVRGAYRSLVPGTSPIGGTLRESVHSAVYKDGRLFRSSGTPMDEMGPAGQSIVGYVGTNTGYGAYVELGTRKMQARPFLSLGLDRALERAAGTFARGMGRAKR